MENKLLSFSEIQEKIDSINKYIGLKETSFPAYGKSEFFINGNCSWIIEEKGEYSLIVEDDWGRGTKHLVVKTPDINELVFWVFEAPTHWMAWQYELKNRIPNQDSRIIAFKKHIEILESLPLEKKYINELKKKYNSLLGMELFKTEG
jgi:hypothetical protein